MEIILTCNVNLSFSNNEHVLRVNTIKRAFSAKLKYYIPTDNISS